MKDDRTNVILQRDLIMMTYHQPTRRRRTVSSSTCDNLNLFLLLSFALLALPLLLPSPVSAFCNQSDRDSLTSFFNSTSSSPPLNWTSADCCSWEGIICEAKGDKDDRVINLWLPFRGLSGTISPLLKELTYLSLLNLSHNQLSGSLPSEFFSSLNHLQLLDLSFNLFSDQLQLPNSINATNNVIEIVDLSSNRFLGIIPSSFLDQVANSGTLTSFNVSNNSFSGPIPTSFCLNTSLNCSIRFLDFSYNRFSGEIDLGLGRCSNLSIFRAGVNNLVGPIPMDLYNATSLEEISLPLNHISGNISSDINHLKNLRVLELYSNRLTGYIPENIGELSGLEVLTLHINNLTGTIPPSLMNCTNLVILNLRVNSFQGDLSALNFSKLLQLATLDLGNNQFSGNIPSTLYSCTALKAVRLSSNQITGEILPGIVALQFLSFLSISNNKLTNIKGAIINLMGCKSLGTLVLSKNFYHEELPYNDDIGDPIGFQYIQVLSFGANSLTGQVPTWIAKLGQLEVLDLSFNNLTGSIPSWLGNLPNIFYLDLSNNLLTGEFPVELCNMSALESAKILNPAELSYLALPVFVAPNNATNQQYNQLSSLPPAIYLGNNSISGNIPLEIGQLVVLHVLDLSHNNFSGNIPDMISDLINLEMLDLSHNHLTGQIPSSLKGLHFLSSFSVANNNLQGPIPSGVQFDTFGSSSFEGNPGLCGPPIVDRSCSSPSVNTNPTSQRKSSNKKLVIGLVFGVCLIISSVITMLALWIVSKRRIISRVDPDNICLEAVSSSSNLHMDKDSNMVILFSNNINEIKGLTMSDILKATDDFNQENIVGCGGFGLVYKATLANGAKLAIKKLTGDLGLMEREFRAEVEALSAAQHENLVTLQGYCVHEGARLLMYSYMENGSLDSWLHEKADGPSQLDWPTRLKIARGASSGLAYMHQTCEPHIVHRDIKSSNILLDEKFKAHVADFGLSRLINPYQTHVTTELVGTLGYIPPEYGQAWVATLRGDIYSFGVVILELLTGKRPMEVSKPKAIRDLVTWVQHMRSEGRPEEVFDPLLRGKGYDTELLQVLDVACMCVNHNPFKRPAIKEVVDWLKNVGTIDPYQELKVLL